MKKSDFLSGLLHVYYHTFAGHTALVEQEMIGEHESV